MAGASGDIATTWGRLHGGQLLAARRLWFGATIEEVVQLDGQWTVDEVKALEARKVIGGPDMARYQRVIERLRERDRQRRRRDHDAL